MEQKAENRIIYYRVPEGIKKGRLEETLTIIWWMRKSYPLIIAGAAFMLLFSESLITSVGAFFLGMAFLISLSGYLNYMKMKRLMERAAIRAEIERRKKFFGSDNERKAA